MLRYGFFDSEITGFDEQGMPIFDRAESSDFLAMFISHIISDGVLGQPGDCFQVLAGEGMKLGVRPGFAVIQGRFAVDLNMSTVTVPEAPKTHRRIDRVVLRADYVERLCEIVVKEGVPAANPVPPELLQPESGDYYELCLATVAVNSNQTVITQSDITDTRYDSSVCGVVTQVIDHLDTSVFFAQLNQFYNEFVGRSDESYARFVSDMGEYLDSLQAAGDDKILELDERFMLWFDAVKGQLAGDLAARILQMLNDHLADKDNPHDVHAEDIDAIPLSGGQMDKGAGIIFDEGKIIFKSKSGHIYDIMVDDDTEHLQIFSRTMGRVPLDVDPNTGVVTLASGVALNSATPSAAGLQYLLGIDSFQQGGKVHWSSAGDVTVGTSEKVLSSGVSSNFYNGRDTAVVRLAAQAANQLRYVMSVKTVSGSWDVGSFSLTPDALLFYFINDSDYSAGSNRVESGIYFTKDGGVHSNKMQTATVASQNISFGASQDNLPLIYSENDNINFRFRRSAGGAVEYYNVGAILSSLQTLEAQTNELKNSVSNGKALVASAITAKGVSTAANAAFAVMANNIAAINTGFNFAGSMYGGSGNSQSQTIAMAGAAYPSGTHIMMILVISRSGYAAAKPGIVSVIGSLNLSSAQLPFADVSGGYVAAHVQEIVSDGSALNLTVRSDTGVNGNSQFWTTAFCAYLIK